MKITEQQMFDYMFCPAKFEMRYIRRIDIPEPVTMQRLLNKIAKYFYLNLFNGKVCTMNEVKNKWDSICVTYPEFIDQKKAILGWGLIINLLKWASGNQISILDVDTQYHIVRDGIELVGCMEPILLFDNKTELLVNHFGDKYPDKTEIDMKLKYTLDCLAFKSTYNKELNGIHIRAVKLDKDIYTTRTEPDFRRLETTIKNVGKAIKNEIFYPRENNLCSVCNAREYCKYWTKEVT
jgi:hypothetical protein